MTPFNGRKENGILQTIISVKWLWHMAIPLDIYKDLIQKGLNKIRSNHCVFYWQFASALWSSTNFSHHYSAKYKIDPTLLYKGKKICKNNTLEILLIFNSVVVILLNNKKWTHLKIFLDPWNHFKLYTSNI